MPTPDNVADPGLALRHHRTHPSWNRTTFPKTMLGSTRPPHNWENP